jgi:hypothetical protein
LIVFEGAMPKNHRRYYALFFPSDCRKFPSLSSENGLQMTRYDRRILPIRQSYFESSMHRRWHRPCSVFTQQPIFERTPKDLLAGLQRETTGKEQSGPAVVSL